MNPDTYCVIPNKTKNLGYVKMRIICLYSVFNKYYL